MKPDESQIDLNVPQVDPMGSKTRGEVVGNSRKHSDFQVFCKNVGSSSGTFQEIQCFIFSFAYTYFQVFPHLFDAY